MRILVTGAGQIARGLVDELTSRGDEAIVLRRASDPVPGARTTSGDAADRALLGELARDADAIVHTVHAAYDPVSWRRELPHREQAVMDVAAELGIPVIFPESVYAFGRGAEDLREGAPVDPCSPLGRVRAELLEARARHAARTISVVAADLLGPTATAKGSVPRSTVIDPVRAGRTAWVLGDPDAPHSITWIPDLARAMLAAVERSASLAPDGDAVLHAPTPPAISLRQLARAVAAASGSSEPAVRSIPVWAMLALAPFSSATRSLRRQLYLWDRPAVLREGRLTTELGLRPTHWDAIVASEIG